MSAAAMRSEQIYPNKLALGIRERDMNCLHLLYDRYSTILYSLIASIVQDSFTADAVLEKVVHRIWNGIHEFDEAKQSLFSWMIAIARAEAIKTRKSIDPGFLSAKDGLPQTRYAQELRGMADLIDQLPQTSREVVRLCYIDGMDDKLISKGLNIPVDNMKASRNAGLRIMHKLISRQK
jgi:RNA polymerase sigma factor (sigma-70 family)